MTQKCNACLSAFSYSQREVVAGVGVVRQHARLEREPAHLAVVGEGEAHDAGLLNRQNLRESEARSGGKGVRVGTERGGRGASEWACRVSWGISSWQLKTLPSDGL